ncbi:DUF3962 domain-containing protein [Promicromonospora sp. MEB111]|uniref:pPIWI_RE module domain-containing protein n=1 Tax=Promicromonospora sp. MEB111 TaxID=3040301 RepID=UPI002550EF1E|nr:DUF3962 domain-containing protein [Promicromonospora sp. MEB111]
MTHDVETAAYRLRHTAELPDLLGSFHSFDMPEHWPDVVRQVWDHGGKPHDPSWSLPIAKRLNHALRALVPDVLYTGKLGLASADTWLYAREPVDTGLLKRTMQTYLQGWLDTKSDYPKLREAVMALDVASHAGDWRPANVDPAWVGVNAAGTATVDPVLYRLIPEAVAARILAQGKYDGELSFVQVATNEGAELMSWPPLEHVEKGKGRETKVSRYSAVITIALMITPFDPAPRLHLGVKIRRWVSSGKLFIPTGSSASVYLRPPTDPAAGPGQTRFAVPYLQYDKATRANAWKSNGPAGVLAGLTVAGRFPDAARISTDPGAYLPPTTGLEAAVTHHTRMTPHAVQTGIMPDERRRILTWAAAALPEAFEPAVNLEAVVGRPKLERQYVKRTSIPKEPTPPKKKPDPEDTEAMAKYADDFAKYERDHTVWKVELPTALERRAEDDAENARRNRELLRRGMQGTELRIDVVTDTDAVRAALLGAAGDWLGLAPTEMDMPQHVVFREGGLAVRLVCHSAGRLTSPLGNGTQPARGDAHQQAIRDRAALVQEYLEAQEFKSELVLAEILAPKEFTATLRSDPYDAVRQGAARAGRVTQFITTSGEGELAFRAQAAWADGLRSLGISLVPPSSKNPSLPKSIDQVAFWQVRRNVTGTVSKAVWMPIAVLVKPDQARVLARTPESQGWIPYNQLLCELATAEPRLKELSNAQRQTEEMARFLRVTLPALKGRPLLLLAEAANLRSRWTWLTDSGLEADRISLGEPDTMRLATHNKQLRVVRVRTDANRLETPMWWATPRGDEPAGFTKTVLQAEGAGEQNRVFYSLAEKSSKLNTHNKALRKLTRDGTKAPSPDKAAPVPRMIELTVAGLAPTDDAAAATAWATFVHQQRFTADYPEGRELPYALDLCRRAGDYAFPESAREDKEDGDPAPGDPEPEQGVLDL